LLEKTGHSKSVTWWMNIWESKSKKWKWGGEERGQPESAGATLSLGMGKSEKNQGKKEKSGERIQGPVKGKLGTTQCETPKWKKEPQRRGERKPRREDRLTKGRRNGRVPIENVPTCKTGGAEGRLDRGSQIQKKRALRPVKIIHRRRQARG